MAHSAMSRACGAASALLAATAVSACSGAASSAPPKSAPPASVVSAAAPSAFAALHTGFVGWQWAVTAIANGGAAVPVPAGDGVYLEFTRDGLFIANEPVNTHSGAYHVTSEGFSTGEMATTAVGGGAADKAGQLAILAFDSFSQHPGTRATVDVTGKQMTVTENGFTLTCTRATPAHVASPSPT